MNNNIQKAYFAGGCFWGMQEIIRKLPGVILLEAFFAMHDPTQLNRQGPDMGEQYRSAVFYANEEQKRTAEKLVEILKQRGYAVVTEIMAAGDFWEAEDYHQKYYAKNGHEPYCHVRKKRF